MGKGGGVGESGVGECSVNGGDGERLLSNFLQPFLDRRSCNDGSRELIPVFHNPHRKCQLATPLTLAWLCSCKQNLSAFNGSELTILNF